MSCLARKPIFVNNYKPVYQPDIGSKGFHTVMTENGELTRENVGHISDIIYNPDLAGEIADHNFELVKLHVSFDTLGEKLEQLIALALSAA